jgi:hypothetical protein
MSGEEEDDKPTVVLDLNALKKQKLKADEDLANIASELEFNVGQIGISENVDSEEFAEKFLGQRQKAPQASKVTFPVILFDFQSDFFKKSINKLPKGFDYKMATDLNELNHNLKSKNFQIVVFNYDVNPKAVNQLCAQLKQKFPTTKTLIMAKLISPEKAKIHARTACGADGYYQFPLDATKIEKEFLKIQSAAKKAG